mgnify:CR=1 FL=1
MCDRLVFRDSYSMEKVVGINDDNVLFGSGSRKTTQECEVWLSYKMAFASVYGDVKHDNSIRLENVCFSTCACIRSVASFESGFQLC